MTTALVLTPVAAVQPVEAVLVPSCSRGLVALTFDDGPSKTVTAALLDVLHDRRVPATFFVVGERVAASPFLVRRTALMGFQIGNHTYHHEKLTSLSGRAIAQTIRATRQAIVNAGVRPSWLMRPPYGSIDARVRRRVRKLGYVPVLWTVDPRDWDGKTSRQITSSVLSQLRPGAENVVILHDGVANSPRTLRAVPRIIRRARTAGYCFAALSSGGHPMAPVPQVGVSNSVVVEGDPGDVVRLRFHIRLSRPTSRMTSVVAHTVAGTAKARRDFRPRRLRVYFDIGDTKRTVKVRVHSDAIHEHNEYLHLVLAHQRKLTLGDAEGLGRILDDD